MLGCTDLTNQWKKLGSSKKESYAPCRVTSLCHVVVDNNEEQVTESAGRSHAFHDLVEAAPGCSVGRHVRPALQKVIQPRKDISDLLINSMDVANIPDEHLDEPGLTGSLKGFYDANVKVDHAGACKIAQQSQGSEGWAKERAVRITGSKCYELFTYSRGNSPDWTKKLSSLEKSKDFTGNAATRYGQRSESVALGIYEQLHQGSVVKCGLVVPPRCPWLGFSPDAVVVKDGKPVTLVEVKSPVCGKQLSVREILAEKAVPYLTFDGENGNLKRNHKYYGQVQLGMAVLSVDKCDFVIYGKDGIAVVPVFRDDEFIQRLLTSLHHIFFHVLLPHMCK